LDPEAVRIVVGAGEEYEPVMLVTLGYPAKGTTNVENDRKVRRSNDKIALHEALAGPEQAACAAEGEAVADDWAGTRPSTLTAPVRVGNREYCHHLYT
jgi:hypothetical protein